MKILSLFDGISCGMVALERAGINVERYMAYEIDKYAIQVSKKNYPQIEQCGNVCDGDFTQYQGFDLLLGGSPCTHWSIANKNREVTPDGIGGQLFMQYVRALRESKCRYFLYENNFSIHKDIKSFISQELGVEPIMINSALVSAQHRKRCYWTNVPGIEQPEDRGILLKDILESGYDLRGHDDKKSLAVLSKYWKATPKHTIERRMCTMVAEPVIFNYPHGYNKGGIKHDKTPTITANGSWQHNNFVLTPIKVGCMPSPDGTLKNGQGMRVYSVNGKTVAQTVSSGGLGSSTGLYAIPVDKPIYVVRDGQITIKGKWYPTKLPDGYYNIRKLTPVECERLQTLPDGYTEGISNTQRYKCLGNGWTVDVIAHILKNLKEDTDNE